MGQAGRRWIGGAFMAVTLGWLLLVLLTPAALARDVGGRAVPLVSAGTYLLGGRSVPRRPARALKPEAGPRPVGARGFAL